MLEVLLQMCKFHQKIILVKMDDMVTKFNLTNVKSTAADNFIIFNGTFCLYYNNFNNVRPMQTQLSQIIKKSDY